MAKLTDITRCNTIGNPRILIDALVGLGHSALAAAVSHQQGSSPEFSAQAIIKKVFKKRKYHVPCSYITHRLKRSLFAPDFKASNFAKLRTYDMKERLGCDNEFNSLPYFINSYYTITNI